MISSYIRNNQRKKFRNYNQCERICKQAHNKKELEQS